MMNPWAILGAVLFVIAVAIGADHFGHSRGMNEQAAADQLQFDQINAAITKQKAEAAALYRDAQAGIIALQVERDTLKTKLETDRAANRKATDDLRHALSGERLRFQSAQGAGVGPNSANAVPAGSNAAGNTGAAECVVSESVDRDLKALVYDADTLRDDYKLLYEWAHRVP